MDGAAQQTGGEALVTERVRRRLRVARRRRFVRSVVAIVLLTGAMVTVSMAHRDAQSFRQCRARLEYACREFSENYRNRKLPVLLPHQEADRDWVQGHYVYEWQNDERFAPDRQVGVCCCKKPHRFFLRADGRHLIVHDGRGFRVQWMTEDEFRRRAAGLRLPLSAGQ